MDWFWIALLPPILWSISNHVDKYLFEKYYRNALPGSLMFMTSMMGTIFITFIAIFHHSVFNVAFRWQVILIIAGFINFAYIFPYIYALMRDEASRVVPLFQIAPIISFLLAWAFLHEQLKTSQLIAGLLIVIAAIAMNLDLDKNFRLKKSVLGLMSLSAVLFALEGFLFKYSAIHTGFWSGIFYQYLGIAIAGLLLAIFSPKFRQNFKKIFNSNKKMVLSVTVINELLILLALISFNYASLLAPLALVALLTNTGPIFVFIFGIIISLIWPKLGRENLKMKHLSQKIICILIIYFGTYLILK